MFELDGETLVRRGGTTLDQKRLCRKMEFEPDEDLAMTVESSVAMSAGAFAVVVLEEIKTANNLGLRQERVVSAD